MSTIKQGYEVSYNVIPEFIRSRTEGNFNGNDFKPAVTLTAENVYEVENQSTDTIDIKKSELSFEILCENKAEVQALSRYFLGEMKAHRPILLTGDLPYGDKVKCYEDAQHFLSKISKSQEKVK